MTRRTAVTAALAAAAALAGAAPVVGQMPVPGGDSASGRTVAIDDAGYSPATVVAAPGQPVVWNNEGRVPHTVSADNGAFDSGTLQPTATFELTAPAATGSYTYFCRFHSFMRGTLAVSTINLEGPRVVVVGNPAAIQGQSPGTAAGTAVVVEVLASGAWTGLTSTTVAADGTFSVRTPALSTSVVLRARIGAEVSAPLNVPVAPRVVARRAGRTLTVSVRPALAGKARLERLNLNTYRWKTVRPVSIPADGQASVRVPGAGWFRVTVLPAGGFSAASSPVARFR
jgi:plastocyanin